LLVYEEDEGKGGEVIKGGSSESLRGWNKCPLKIIKDQTCVLIQSFLELKQKLKDRIV